MVGVDEQFFQRGRSTCHKRVETLEHAGVISPGARLGREGTRNRHNRISWWGDVAGSGTLRDALRDAVKRPISSPTLQIAQRHANVNVNLDRLHILNIPIHDDFPLFQQTNCALNNAPF
jgi:hypothetical protein